MPMREYIDPTGRKWNAWAVYPTETISGRIVRDIRAAGGWLAFQSGDERRRFYPPAPRLGSLVGRADRSTLEKRRGGRVAAQVRRMNGPDLLTRFQRRTRL